MNEEDRARIAAARAALATFVNHTGDNGDEEDNLVDLLVALMLLADWRDIDVYRLIARATRHYEREV